MANPEHDREESQQDDHFVNLEQRRDREHNLPSVMVETQYIEHTRRSQSRTRSHVSHEQEMRNLKLEIDHFAKSCVEGNTTKGI